MSDHQHAKDSFSPFGSDDPLTMMGAAMVGMALEEAAEQEERQRRARLTPAQRAAEDQRGKEIGKIIVIAVVTILVLFCVFLFMGSFGY